MPDERSEAAVVIGGGVGPMAGVAAHARIIESTLTGGLDQAHLTVLHFSRSSAIPDRTAYLLALREGQGEELALDPVPGMVDVFMAAERALGEGERAVGGIPCIAFHIPRIFDRFLAELEARANRIRVLNMHTETLDLLGERLGGRAGGRVGVLAATGTRMSGVFDLLLEKAGYETLYVDESLQPELHAAVYDPEWGVKAVNPPTGRAIATIAAMADRLVERGANALISACTELPLALPDDTFKGVPLVDPVLALARGLVREAAPEKLRPLMLSRTTGFWPLP